MNRYIVKVVAKYEAEYEIEADSQTEAEEYAIHDAESDFPAMSKPYDSYPYVIETKAAE